MLLRKEERNQYFVFAMDKQAVYIRFHRRCDSSACSQFVYSLDSILTPRSASPNRGSGRPKEVSFHHPCSCQAKCPCVAQYIVSKPSKKDTKKRKKQSGRRKRPARKTGTLADVNVVKSVSPIHFSYYRRKRRKETKGKEDL